MIDRKPDWLGIPIKTPFMLTLDDPPESPIPADPPKTDPPESHQGMAAPSSQRYYINLLFIATWSQHELLMLIRQHVDISTVKMDWLLKFREDLDIMSDGSR